MWSWACPPTAVLPLSLSPVSPADTKRKVEEISEELRSLDTRLWSDRDSEPPSQGPEGTQDGMAPVPSSR